MMSDVHIIPVVCVCAQKPTMHAQIYNVFKGKKITPSQVCKKHINKGYTDNLNKSKKKNKGKDFGDFRVQMIRPDILFGEETLHFRFLFCFCRCV